MLFNSFVFLLAFLPITLLGFYWIGNKFSPNKALAWLVICSLFFYGSWHYAHLGILLSSLIFNYLITGWMTRANRGRLSILVVGLIANVGLLLYFKMIIAGFIGLPDSQNHAFSTEKNILIPLGISFITFQKIALLVDTYKGRLGPIKPLEYCLFVTFFPQLIMGPIVHYREFEPQLKDHSFLKWHPDNFSIAITIFIIGLFKKVVLADGIAPQVNLIYELVSQGEQVHPFDIWLAAIGFSFQLYFDFSGYSDMAIGLARMFNINLPINFDSPYRAIDRFDFWRRWHISFGSFMRQYVFFPLARSKKVKVGNIGALTITTLMSGLWHGVSMTYIIWGASQSILMIIIHYRNHLLDKLQLGANVTNKVTLNIKMCITFIVSVMLSVLFRSNNIQTALSMFSGMFLPITNAIQGNISIGNDDKQHYFDTYASLELLTMMIIIWGFPNLKYFFGSNWKALDQRSNQPQKVIPDLMPGVSMLKFKPTRTYALIMSILLFTVLAHMTQPTRFIYYQF